MKASPLTFMPVLLLRYAGIPYELPSKLLLGHPLGGCLLTARARFSVPSRVEVPLVMNRRRALLDLSKRLTKIDVMICVPTVLTFHDWFHIWRMVICPEASCWSSCAPMIGHLFWVNLATSRSIYTSIIDQHIEPSELGLYLMERFVNRAIVLNIDLDWPKLAM